MPLHQTALCQAGCAALSCPGHELSHWHSPSGDWLLRRSRWNPPKWTVLNAQRGWWHIQSCDSAHAEWRCVFWHFLARVGGSIEPKHFPDVCCSCFFVPVMGSHLRGNLCAIFALLATKQSHPMPVSHVLLASYCVSSLQPGALFCLWPFTTFPWYLCSLKSSALCSATSRIVNTSKTLQTPA